MNKNALTFFKAREGVATKEYDVHRNNHDEDDIYCTVKLMLM